MKISYDWLSQYLDLRTGPEETAHILTFCGLEVESVEEFESIEGGLKGVVIGQVISCAKHPDADRLTVCQVDYGEGPLQIVCGAPNVAPGQKIPVATVGTELYHSGKKTLIQKSTIRGVESHGMICAEDELGLGSSHAGIMVLDANAKIGSSAADYFRVQRDHVFEIGLTPNRADAASHIGTARDLVAYFNCAEGKPLMKLKYPGIDDFKVDDHSLPIEVEIIDTDACPRYSGISLTGVKVGPSPAWLQNRLKSVGLRPLNNVVDISNFVLMELGHPLHAFDADKITGRKVIIRTEPEGTIFTTLDGIQRRLASTDLMICDSKQGMCIAGVFGGEHSGVTEATRNIFLESAYFVPSGIRKTARRHGLNTDASFRFERGADPNITIIALKRAAMLIKEMAGGMISSEIIDIYSHPIPHGTLSLRKHSLKRIAGFEIPDDSVERILLSLEFRILDRINEGWHLEVPSFKVDVTREIDIIEEVLRIYGFNNIPLPAKIEFSPEVRSYGDEETLRNVISKHLIARGFNEAMNNSLTSSSNEKLGFIDAAASVRMLNAVSTELDVMRQSMLPGMLGTALHNINRQNRNLRFFEFGVVYRMKAGTGDATERFDERPMLSLLITGRRIPENWRDQPAASTIFDLRHELESVIMKIGLEVDVEAMSAIAPFDEMIGYSLNGTVLGRCGTISGSILKHFEIEQDIVYAELDFDLLSREAAKVRVEFNALPKFPEVRRDLALVFDRDISFSSIRKAALRTGGPMLKDLNLFDVYEGEAIGKEKISYAVSFVLQDVGSTLTDAQIDSVMSRIIGVFEKEFSAKLRQA